MDTSKDINSYDLLPSYSDTAISEQKITISPENIYYCPGDLQNTYLLVGAFDITSDTPCIPDTILGSGDTIYMNAENLYIARQNWLSDSESSGKVTTDIYRFSANEASLNYTGSGSVDGYIINQYSMDEYNGFFRIATTSTDSDWNESNNVFILDSSLNIVGSITDMAPGETIQSVRFDGDTGYVITFEQIDPLFVLDLSTPENPSVLGELKIPGFSEYLHPFGDNLLLGIGRHTSELYSRDEYGNETIEGITDKGLKISIFDVNDPSTPTEISKIVLGSDWNTYSEVSYNPRSLMTDFEKGIIGVPVCSYDDYTNGEFYGYVLLQIDSDGIESLANLGSDTWCDNPRICYIGNYLYLILNDSVMVYNYSNYTLQNTVNINFAEQINEYDVIVCY